MIKILCFILVGMLTACGNMTDDLNPSGNDLRPSVVANSIGSSPTQILADFSAPKTTAGTFTLSDYLAGGAQASDAIVFYFTMWCPICMSHGDHMLYNIMPQFQGRGTVRYVLIDYVSGSLAATTTSEAANGYTGSPYIVLADINQALLTQLQGAMGKTIVLDSNGIVLMNEDFRTGDRLINTLNNLLP